MLQQSQALSSLVTHLLSQQDGGVKGLTSSASSSSYVGSKAAAKKEKLQSALATRSAGDFFLGSTTLCKDMKDRLSGLSGGIT